MSDPVLESAPRSRRALLAAAAGVAAAAAATVVAPAAALAADPDDVAKSQDNATTAVTSITQSTADTDAFQAHGLGTGHRRRRDHRRHHERRRRRPRGRYVPLRHTPRSSLDHRRRPLRLRGPDRALLRASSPRARSACTRTATSRSYADGGTVGVFASAAPSAGRPSRRTPAPAVTTRAARPTSPCWERWPPGARSASTRLWPGGPPRPQRAGRRSPRARRRRPSASPT